MIISISKAVYEAKVGFIENQKKEPEFIVMSKLMFRTLRLQDEAGELSEAAPMAHNMKILTTEDLNDFEIKLF